jgi:uncharacterized protein YggT (Ycf19 family)
VERSTIIGFERFARAITYLLYFVVLLAIVILLFGFFLLLFGANPHAPFAEWVYRALGKVMNPFRGLFRPVDLSGNSVLDTSILFAMVVYGIVGMVLRSLIDWLTYRVALMQGRPPYAVTPGAVDAPPDATPYRQGQPRI